MKKVCKHCKYYVENRYSKIYANCLNEKLAFKGLDECKDDELVYSDYYGYDAYLKVGENFGCIHWTKKGDK